MQSKISLHTVIYDLHISCTVFGVYNMVTNTQLSTDIWGYLHIGSLTIRSYIHCDILTQQTKTPGV